MYRSSCSGSIAIFSQAIFKKHFKENPYFRNNLFEHTTQYFAESVSMCSSHCGQCCECFGFNVINKTCRVPVSCDPGVILGKEDGWIYFTEHVTGNNRRRQNTWKNDVTMITLIWKMDQYMMCWLFPVAKYQSRITCIRLSDWWNLTASIEVWTSVSDRWKNRDASFVFFG